MATNNFTPNHHRLGDYRLHGFLPSDGIHSYQLSGPSLLYSRQFSPDPYLSFTTFQRTYYPLRSIVKRLILERQLKDHDGCVNCINFSSTGQLLSSGSDDLHVILWDWATGYKVAKFDSGHVANVFQAKFMPHTSDSVLVTAARDGQVRCQVISSSGSLVTSKRVAHHSDSAHKLAVEPDSPYVFLSCGEDGGVLEVDLREEAARRKLLVCKSEKRSRVPLYSIFIDPSNFNNFAISGRDQFARVFDRRMLRDNERTDTVEPLIKFCPHHLESPANELRKANITCLVYSYDGKEILCSYNDESIYSFDASHSTGSEYLRKYQGHRNSQTVKGVNYFGLQSDYVVSGSDCGHVFLWDRETTEIVQCLHGDYEGVVNCLEPHPSMPVLATSGLDHDVKIFTPSARDQTTLEGIKELAEQNCQERDDSLAQPADDYEHLMHFILRQYRRNIRHRIGIPDDSDSGEEPEHSDSEDSDEEGGRGRQVRCVQS